MLDRTNPCLSRQWSHNTFGDCSRTMTFLELTDCSFGSIHPSQMWLSLLDMSANFTVHSAKVPVDLLPGAIHCHNVWYAIALVEQRKRLMRF